MEQLLTRDGKLLKISWEAGEVVGAEEGDTVVFFGKGDKELIALGNDDLYPVGEEVRFFVSWEGSGVRWGILGGPTAVVIHGR